MLPLGINTDYALIALAYMVERGDQLASARAIAEAHGLSLPLMAKVLKMLHQRDLLKSVRGVKGGYRIGVNLNTISLYDLMAVLGGERLIDVDQQAQPRSMSGHAPAVALQYRLIRFLRDVSLSDLVIPGRRIEVPLEMLSQRNRKPMAERRVEELAPVTA
jgi:Rrf2 family protein